MKNEAPRRIGWESEVHESLEETAKFLLSESTYDNGVLEDVAERACNNSEAIGRLLDWLADTGQITAAVVAMILDVDEEDITFITKESPR